MKRILLPFVPALGSFGPLFIVIGLNAASRTPPISFGGYFALVGAFMTGCALMIMFREITSLRQLLEEKNEKHGDQ